MVGGFCRDRTGDTALYLDKKDSILENANTLIGLPPYLADQCSSTSN